MPLTTYTAGQVLTASSLNSNFQAAGGLQYITQATMSTGSTSINNCFSSTYRNYRIIVNLTGVSAESAALYFRLRASGTDNTTTNYKVALANISTTGTVGSTIDNGGNAATLSFIASASVDNYFTLDVNGPNTVQRTLGSVQTMGYDSTAWVQRTGGFYFDTGAVFDGITFFTNTGTVNGLITVYGYRNT